MTYNAVCRGIFLSRPNRFIAHVSLEGQEVVAHVKNTGRCRELLVPGYTVYLEKASNPNRKTAYDLFAVEKQCPDGTCRLIHMDSQGANDIAHQWLQKKLPEALIRREVFYDRSRFDFYIETSEGRGFLEVKGVTLEENGIASFPDAPTERGVRHLRELMACRREGYGACLLFVVQMPGITCVRPNDKTHPEFGQVLREAAAAGVKVLAVGCDTTPTSIEARDFIPVDLSL